MRILLTLILVCSLSGCASSAPGGPTLAQRQIAEAQEALSKGQITMAEFLNLKQQAIQASELRRTIILASPD